MNDIADIINRPQSMSAELAKSTSSLRDSVSQCLDNYFAQLGDQSPADVYEMVLREIEEPLLRKIMQYTGNNQSRAAKLLGLSRGTLRKKLKIYDLLYYSVSTEICC